MAAPAILLSIDGLKKEKVKVSAAQLLVRRLVAIEIVAKKLYQRLEVKSADLLKSLSEPAKPCKPITYQHHIEPRLCRISRREMEELERYQQMSFIN